MIKRLKKIFIILLFGFINLSSFSQSDFGICPKKESVYNDTIINFLWNSLGEDFTYKIEISKEILFTNIEYSETTFQLSSTVNSLEFNTKYFWKVVGSNGGTFIESPVYNFLITKINTLQNIIIWKSATDSAITDISGNVKYWRNLINPSDSSFQTISDNQPLLINNDSLLNYQSSIYFDGINDNLFNSNSTKIGAMYVVSRWSGVEEVFPTINGIIASNGAVRPYAYFFVSQPSTTRIYTSSTPWGASNIYVNNEQTLEYSPLSRYKILYGETETPSEYSGLVIGSSKAGDRYWEGNVAEILAFDTIPSDSAKNIINGYLQNKYSPPVNLGYDINSDGFCDITISAHKPWFTEYLWNNGSSDSVITVSNDSTYMVTVKDIFGNISSDSIIVSFPQPIQMSDTTICIGDSILWDTGLEGNYTYLWNGSTSTDSAIYINEGGTYTVTINDSEGCEFTSESIAISIDSFPNQNSLGIPRDVCKYEAITLKKQGPDIQHWNWSTGSNDSYVNVDTTSYWLKVTNGRGCIDSVSNTYTIIGIAPNAQFFTDTVCYNDSTSFTNSTTIESGYTIDSVLWEFGDGKNSKFWEPKHLYTASDTFVVQLTAYSGSCNSIYEKSIIMKQNPNAGFEIQYGAQHCINSKVQFYDTSISTFPIISYNWDFDNASTSVDQNPINQFTNIGNYNVKLVITTNNECVDSIANPITITDAIPSPINVILENPKDDLFIAKASNILFQWSNVQYAVHYTFEIAKDSMFTQIEYKQIDIEQNHLNYNLTNQGNYYWRIFVYNACGDSTISEIRSIQLKPIDNLDNINIWFDASNGIITDIDNKVEYWQNLINPSDSSFQNISDNQPLLINNDSLLNYQPTIYFDGINDNLFNSNSTKIGAMYVVSRWSGVEEIFPTINGIVASNGVVRPYAYFFAGQPSTSNIYTSSTPWGAENIYVNNEQTLEFTPVSQYKILYGETETPSEYSGLVIGSSKAGDRYWEGYIAEIIAFDTIPSDSAKNIINKYLQNKYSPAINLGTDIFSEVFSDTTISAYQPWFTSYSWIYNGDTISNDSAIAATINTQGTYHVEVTDIFGFTSTDSITVTYPEPHNISDTSICLFDTVIWNPQLTGDYTYEWSNGETTPTLDITQDGDYWLIISDNLGNPWYSDTVAVNVNQFPATVSLGNDTTLCQGNRVYLQNGFAEAETYLWNTGSSNEYITLETAGIYSVIVTDSLGCIGKDTVNLGMEGISPNVTFSYAQVCDGEVTLFTDESSTSVGSTINQWLWTFGDGQSSDQQNSEHQYNTSGLYELELIATSSNNCSNNIKEIVQIFALPQADFVPTAGCSNTSVQFYDQSLSVDDEITLWDWTFTNDSIITEQNPSFTFSEADTYGVQLIAISEHNCKDTIVKDVEIRQGPITDFSYSPACEGYPVYFTDASEGHLGLPLIYEWFINKTYYSERNPTVQFTDTGLQAVQLTTTQSSNNCTSTKLDTVFIAQNPVANFTYPSICVANPTQFTDSSIAGYGVLNFWEYEIDSVGIIRQQSPIVTFGSGGTREVSFRVGNEVGCRDTLTEYVEVNELPIPNFLVNPVKGSVPLFVDFENQSTNANGYYWDFGDGESSDEKNPTHYYSDSGLFAINLLAYNAVGCIDSMQGSFTGIVPRVDLVVTQTLGEVINGYLNVSTVIQNQGTLDYPEIELFYKTNYGQNIKELYDTPLLSGQTHAYTFTTQMEIKSNVTLTHVCASGYPVDLTDEVLDNNEDCYAFDNSFNLLTAHPNPAEDVLNIEYIIPFDATVKISLFDLYGKSHGTLYKGESTEGYNRHEIDVSRYRAGVYIYRIEYEDIVHSFQVVIL